MQEATFNQQQKAVLLMEQVLKHFDETAADGAVADLIRSHWQAERGPYMMLDLLFSPAAAKHVRSVKIIAPASRVGPRLLRQHFECCRDLLQDHSPLGQAPNMVYLYHKLQP